MTGRRKAEAEGVRRWQGDVASDNELDEVREWVLWGVGDPGALEIEEAEEGGDLAWMIAEEHDPKWAGDDSHERWVYVLRADEDDVDAVAQDSEAVRGYAPHLIELDRASASPDVMTGNLRGDRVRRRPFDSSQPT
jgi:hypothetical protein